MATSLQQRTGGIVQQAVDRGAGLLAERIEHYTGVARAMADTLREHGEPQLASVVDRGVTRASGVTKYLRDTDPQRLMSDAQEYARGRTWMIAGTGFLGGLLLARAVRASISDNDSEWHEPPYVEQFDQERAYGRR